MPTRLLGFGEPAPWFTARSTINPEFHFDTGDRYRADGAAHVLTAGVPAPSVVIAACALRLVDGPDGLLGGVATSASLFNPTNQPGAETGSIWTLVAYF